MELWFFPATGKPDEVLLQGGAYYGGDIGYQLPSPNYPYPTLSVAMVIEVSQTTARPQVNITF
jgi:hypothetical protein